MIRLIALDLDDTLLNGDGKLTDRSIRAVQLARKSGTAVTIATGRMPAGALPFAEKLGIDIPMIFYNGSLVKGASGVVYRNALPLELTREILRYAEEHGLYVQFFDEDMFYYRKACTYSRAYGAHIGIPGTQTGIPLSEWCTEGAVKLMFITAEKERDALCCALKEKFADRANVMATRTSFVEIVAPGTDKGTALRALCNGLGIPPEEVAAFGDAENDVTMLNVAGTGVCMNNGCPAAKAAADVIAPPNTEDGAAQVLEMWFRETE